MKYEKLESINTRVKIMMVDFWDTLVHRTRNEAYITNKWCKSMAIDMKSMYNRELFFRVRQEAQQCVSHKNGIINIEYSYKNLCDEMYKRLIMIADCNLSEHEFYEMCYRNELSITKKYVYKDINAIQAINKYRIEKNILIVIVSDYNMPGIFLEEIMDYLGILCLIDRIYVSCEYGVNKQSGELYKIVLDDLDIKPSECVMIGDNKIADIRNAKKNGIDAIYKKCNEYPNSNSKEEILDRLKKISVHNDYSNYAFSLYLFIEKLYSKCKKMDIRQLVFFSREGQFLQKLFEKYQKDKNKKIETIYLCISRVASYTPSLDSLENEKFDGIFNRYKNMSMETFLLSIGFSDAQIEQLVSDEFWKMDYVIDDFKNSLEFKKLLSNKKFIDYYEKNRLEQKDYFIRYCKQLGININEKIYIVEVGWRGTIQDNMYKIFDGRVAIQGYYLGLSKMTRYSRDNRKEGVLFSEYPLFSKGFEIWNFDKFMYEKILYASHPSTSRYKINNKKIEPVFKAYIDDTEAYNYVKPMQKRIYDKFNTINHIFEQGEYLAENFEQDFCTIHLKMICLLDRGKIIFQRRMYEYNYETFGEYSLTKLGSLTLIQDGIMHRKISVRQILKNGINLKYFNSISITTYFIEHKMSYLLILLYRILYLGERKRIGSLYENNKGVIQQMGR